MKTLRYFLIIGAIATGIHTLLWLNVTKEYPIQEVCTSINLYKEITGRFPTVKEFEAMEKPGYGLISILKYRSRENDFLIYFCPSILGPCESCKSNGIVYLDEI